MIKKAPPPRAGGGNEGQRRHISDRGSGDREHPTVLPDVGLVRIGHTGVAILTESQSTLQQKYFNRNTSNKKMNTNPLENERAAQIIARNSTPTPKKATFLRKAMTVQLTDIQVAYAQSTADRDKVADGNRKDGNKEIRKKSDRKESRIAFDRTDRNRISKNAHIQSNKASIDAAQSESKCLKNKKQVTRVNKDRICAPRKHHTSSCLDSSLKSKILGESWQKFSRNCNNQRQPKSAKSKGKQTEQAVGANIIRVNSTTTTKPQGQHTGYITSKRPPDSNKL